MSSLQAEMRDGVELLWKQIVGEDDAAANVAAIDKDNRHSGIWVLVLFAIVVVVVFLPFFIMICRLNLKDRHQTKNEKKNGRHKTEIV